MSRLFAIGQVVATPGACSTFDQAFLAACLARHESGDWGDLETEDRAANDEAVKNGSQILSSYRRGDLKLWVITDAGHEVSTLLLPEDY